MTVPRSGPPVIPPPPPGGGKRHKAFDGNRWLIFVGAIGAGVGVGMGGYRVVPAIATYFDYLVALMF